MFQHRIPLFTLFGFKVALDPTWLILAALITWSLAVGYFPAVHPELETATYWWMAVAGTIGLFLSIVLHELSHSLVARRFGLPIKGITLFLFGGVAEMEEEPLSPKAEFQTAIVGPIASFLLAGLFYLLAAAAAGAGTPVAVYGLLSYLALINLVVAIFNLLPAFPLDGGRVLRAALWHWKGRLGWATKVAASTGSLLGIALAILGIVSFIGGNIIGGIWWVLIGLFIRGAAQSSYQQVVTRQVLENVPVRKIMTRDPITVSPDLTLDRLVEDYFNRHYRQAFPVVEGGRLLGIVGLRDLGSEQREASHSIRVGDVMRRRSPENSVLPASDAMHALSLMHRHGLGRIMVAEGDQLLGILSMRDIMRLMTVKLALEGEEAELPPSMDRGA